MPRGWSGIFALCEWILWADLGIDRPGRTLLGVRVCGMGWKYATALCQSAHRRMVIIGYQLPCVLRDPACETVLPESNEVRRDRPFPVCGCRHSVMAWSIYIDNLDLWELFSLDGALAVEGSVAPIMLAADKCYVVWNSPGSPEDTVDRVIHGSHAGGRQ